MSYLTGRFAQVTDRIDLPASGTLAAVTYDEAAATLDVEFRKGGVYRYFLVPRSVVTRLVGADSPGHVYVTEIRGRYNERRIE